jgi:hypothetical protein
MNTFAELVASRRAWIDNELKPWCARASVSQLRLAELEWQDIAGRAAPEMTLWAWAWGRFPPLVNPDLGTIDEAQRIVVVLKDGRRFTGFPNARESTQGMLVLVGRTSTEPKRFETLGPFSLDEIARIEPA